MDCPTRKSAVHAGALRQGEKEPLDSQQYKERWKVIFPFESK